MGDFEALLQRQSSIAASFNENTQDAVFHKKFWNQLWVF